MDKNHLIYFMLVIAFTYISCIGVKVSKPSPSIVTGEKVLMGTLFSISVYTQSSPEKVKPKIEKGLKKVEELESIFSEFNKGSLLSKINKEAGKHPVKVTQDLIRLLEYSLELYNITNGAFNPLWATLKRFWNPIWDSNSITNFDYPKIKEIQTLLEYLNPQYITIDKTNQTVFLRYPEMKLGFGGIAKGYAIDSVGSILEKEGIKDFIVNGGGDLLVSGTKAGNPWIIGIKDPKNPKRIVLRLKVKGKKSIVTSGNYERYIIYKGKKLTHIIDPRTGYPITGEVTSATVICDNATLCDGIATALMVLGIKEGMILVEKLKNIEAILIDTNNRIYKSSNVVQYLSSSEI